MTARIPFREIQVNLEDVPVKKDVPADESLNKFIRQRVNLPGTKFMCKEGGCGACIVTMTTSDPVTGQEVSRAVNSCLVPVRAFLGDSITTVEGLGNRKDGYNKVQVALASFYGTQCGYCSPGMVMNMYSLLLDNPNITRKEIENSFGGNICRCTGYRPILDAFKSLAADAPKELTDRLKDIEDLLKPCSKNVNSMCSGVCGENCGERKHLERTDVPFEVPAKRGIWFRPMDLAELLKILREIGTSSYRLVAGNTAHGVYRTMADQVSYYILTSKVKDLKVHNLEENHLEIGGGMTLTDTMKLMGEIAKKQPEKFGYLETLRKHIDLTANVPVRNMGTIAGNLMIKHTHKEFPSDLFLIFETVGAQICVVDCSGSESKSSPENFLKKDMNRSVVTKIVLPALPSNRYRLETYKIMPRAQNVHAYVNAGFLFEIDEDHHSLSKPRIVYGGIAAKFVHALNTEEHFTRKPLLDNTVISDGLRKLEAELEPAQYFDKDVNYIRNLSICLLYKFFLGADPGKVGTSYRSGKGRLERPLSHATVELYKRPNWPENDKIPKVEGLIQCSGEAEFVYDLPSYPGELFGALVLARSARTVIESIDPSQALATPGVIAFYSAEDIPGVNSFIGTPYITCSPEEVFCSGEVRFGGQPVGVLVALDQDLALKAANLVKIEYKNKRPPVLSTKSVVEAEDQSRIKHSTTLEPKITIDRGKCKNTVRGEIESGEQFHFHMELQTCICIPMEDGMNVFSSTQWMHNVQAALGKFLNISLNSINMQVRRLGGAFGAKITRSAQVALACALAAHKLNRPVRMVLSLETNMEAMGKRDPSYANYEVSFDDAGKIECLEVDFYLDGGSYPNDPSNMLVIPGMQNHYDSSSWKINVYDVTTDIPGTSWMRGPGNNGSFRASGPTAPRVAAPEIAKSYWRTCTVDVATAPKGTIQAMAAIETIMEHIAFVLGKEPQDVRNANMSDEEVLLSNLMNSINASSEYARRKAEINYFNEKNRWRKKGIAMMSMKFPLPLFFDYHALVSIFAEDGSVAVTVGGVEMGQGLNTKVAQACAYALGVSVDMVKIKPSMTLTSPNNSMSGASITSETCVYSVLKCAETLAKRLEPLRNKMNNPSWQELVKEAANKSVDLMATGWHGHQEPLTEYSVYASVVTEVEVDILTGNYHVVRVDLLEDAGESLSPKIDIGQIEGGFVQGLGYFLTERIVYDKETGINLTNRTWNYWPPGAKDIPIDWRVSLAKDVPNPIGVLRSKSTGEPPICLAFSAVMALRHALNSARADAGLEREWYKIAQPCSPQIVFLLAGTQMDHLLI